MISKIYWLSKNEGGRSELPNGERFITVVHFLEDHQYWPKEAWSLVINFKGPIDEARISIADVSFLMGDAPSQFIHPGSKFELLDGPRVVAQGEILSE